jgi:hypothetical protein
MCLCELYAELRQWLNEDTVPETLLCATVPEISYWITLSRKHRIDVGKRPWLLPLLSDNLESRVVIVHSEMRSEPVILRKIDWNRQTRRTLEPCFVSFVDLRSDMFLDPSASCPDGSWLEDHFERLRLTVDRIDGCRPLSLYWMSIESISAYFCEHACTSTPTVHVENTSEPQLPTEYRDNSEKASTTTTPSAPAIMEDDSDNQLLPVGEESLATFETQDTDDNFVIVNLCPLPSVEGTKFPP